MAAKLKASAATLYNNPTFSDVKIKQISNGKTFQYYGHKAILCKDSGFFMRAFTGSFKEATGNIIELHDDDADQFEIVLKFIYTDVYDKQQILKLANGDTTKQVRISIGIHAISDKYDIPRLCEPVARDVLGIVRSVDNFTIVKEALHAYYDVTSHADSPIGKGLTSIVLEDQQDFTSYKDFETIIETFPMFAADIGLHQHRQGAFKVRRGKCPCLQRLSVDTTGLNLANVTTAWCNKCGMKRPI